MNPYIIQYDVRDAIFVAKEMVHSDGTPYRTINDIRKANKKEKLVRYVVFCPECKKAEPVDQWFVSEDLKADGICPHCGAHIPTIYKNDKEYIDFYMHPRYTMLNHKKARIFNSRMAVWLNETSTAFNLISDEYWAFAVNGNYQIKHKLLIYRIVFNHANGQTYIKAAVDGNGKRNKDGFIRPKIRNITFSDVLGFFDVHMITDIQMIIAHRLGIVKGHSLELPENPISSQVFRELNDISTKELITTREFSLKRSPLVNYCVNVAGPGNDFSDLYNCILHYQAAKRNMGVLKKLIQNGNMNHMQKYLQAKSIKRRIHQRNIVYFLYLWLHRIGVKDINIMNRVVDDYIDTGIHIDCKGEDILPFFSSAETKDIWNVLDAIDGLSSKKSYDFFKWVLRGRDANSIYHFITNSFKDPITMRDSAEMYNTVIGFNPEYNDRVGNPKEVHNNLVYENRKYQFANRKIKYDDREKSFAANVDGYEFVLAADTDTLYDIGKEMGICVGSYGNRAVSKSCTILTMEKQGKRIACIQLIDLKSEWAMVQLKGKYNHTVTEHAPVEKWVAKCGIRVQDCPDYTRAITDGHSQFDTANWDYHVENPRDAFDYQDAGLFF